MFITLIFIYAKNAICIPVTLTIAMRYNLVSYAVTMS